VSALRTTGNAVFATAIALGVLGCAPPADDGSSSDDVQSLLPKGSVDHAGIVEAATMQLAGGPAPLILNDYNAEDPFNIRAVEYLPTFAQRLAQFDDYDGQTDWSVEQATAWTGRMAGANFLVIDTSKPCDYYNPHTYLEPERALLNGSDATTCGGRMPNEDALDVTLNFLIRGPVASAVDADALTDGVDQATQPSSDTFPYLAEMNGI
jgi:hypothetical protein